jgi:GNAT superfamily N-acetyltransferase
VWEQWALTGSRRRERLEAVVRADVELLGIPSGQTWIAGDGAAVAVWQQSPVEPVEPKVIEQLTRVARAAFGERLTVIEKVESLIRSHRPTAPHWFLGTVGTRPERQRQGLGSEVLQPVLDELDRTGMPACLETSSAENVAFYSQLGFEAVAHLEDLPDAAPETWVMWRAARER